MSEEREDTFAHLFCRFVGKGDGEYVVGSNAILDEVDDAVSDYSRLPRSCARKDKEWSFSVRGRFSLCRIESIEVLVRVHAKITIPAHVVFS